MQYRPPADQRELEIYTEMVRLAFNASTEEMTFWQSIDPLTTGNSRCLFDENGKILCGMGILDDGALYFNAETPVTTALITAVASPPEHRRKGYIRQLFLNMFEEQRAKGVALTALYPFYFPFYRSFGYELAHDGAEHKVKIDEFKQWRKVKDNGRFVPVDTRKIKVALNGEDDKEGKAITADDKSTALDDLAKLDTIYKSWAHRNMGTIARSKEIWLHKFAHKSQYVPAYLYLDAGGNPAGYIIYHLEDKDNWQRELVIHEMMALDRKAWEAIYAFISNHDSQANKVIFWTSVDSAFSTRLPDPRNDDVKVHPGYMLRVIDIEGAFRQRAFQPGAQGEFAFTLNDEMLPVLSGAYRVRVERGKAEAEKLKKDEGGVRLDAKMLAQIYSGYISSAQALDLGLIEVTEEKDLAGMQAVLSPAGQPRPYMADDF